MFETIAFYLFSAVSIACFAVSVFTKNVLHALSALAGGMIFISALFFLLGAEFLGVVQIVVYVGAVMVLYGFSMMFFDFSKPVHDAHKFSSKLSIYTLSVFIAVTIIVIFLSPIVGANMSEKQALEGLSNIEAVGILLFSKYLLVFELIAILLLVAMVAGIVLAHKDMDKQNEIEELL
ncbi:MAG: NADH-quinone oxidoreductase subunit J [Campylobacter sp.]|nr:NADH-quinone oxidoreductase subunit J [Campylobacter sp.]